MPFFVAPPIPKKSNDSASVVLDKGTNMTAETNGVMGNDGTRRSGASFGAWFED